MGVLGLLFAFCIGVFYVKRALWVSRNRAKGGSRKLYRGGAALGNALQELQVFVQPRAEHVIQERLEEVVDEDDSGEPKDPAEHLMRQARRIRNGEQVERLTTLLPP
jgi:hypothetical protein